MRGHVLHGVSFVILALACSTSTGVIQSSLPRDTSPTVSSADASELSNDDAAFAFDLYQRIAIDDSTNLFYSPYSVSIALAMAYNGAAGETAQQMAQALHFSLPVARLNAAFDAVDLALATRAAMADYSGHDGGFALNVADALWVDKTLPIEQPFVDALGQSYGSGLRTADFIGAPDASRVAINDWVSEETNDKIEDLLPSGSIDGSTRLVLVDAIYFHAAWASQFVTNATQDEPFTLPDGTSVTASAMHQELTTSYASGSGWQAVQLPYVGEQTSMVVLVPDSGQLESIEHGLTGDFLQQVFASLSPALVDLKLPKFTIAGATISLADALKALGMVDAFESGVADFSLVSSSPLHVSDVLQQAFVSVDENGTEAAAATAVTFADAGAEAIPAPTPVPLDVNRPFFFFVRDIPTNTVLFVGRVIHPT